MSMQIVVQPGTKKKALVIDVDPGESIASLFQKISDIVCVEKNDLRFVFSGKEFRSGDASTDHKPIADIGLKDRSMVQLVTAFPGGH